MENIGNIISELSHFFMGFGYVGIFIMMTLEASFIPFPSEVALLPAGYMIGAGKMSFFPAILAGTLGSLCGALINYFLGATLGRKLLINYGKYLFLTEEKLKKMEFLFEKRGELIVFLGRFIPVVRQYISFPPGIVKMNVFKFSIFTSIGAGIYVTVMVILGYFYKGYEKEITTFISDFKYLVAILVIGYIAFKIYRFRRGKKVKIKKI